MIGQGIEDRRLTKNRIEREKALIESIHQKIDANFNLTIEDVFALAKAQKISKSNSINALHDLLDKSDNVDKFNKIKLLINTFNKQEPFDDIQDTLRPSILRITELCEASCTESDKTVINPIYNALLEREALRKEKLKYEKRNTIAYIITIIGFIVGIIGVGLSFRSPSMADISKLFLEIQKTSSLQKID